MLFIEDLTPEALQLIEGLEVPQMSTETIDLTELIACTQQLHEDMVVNNSFFAIQLAFVFAFAVFAFMFMRR